eukprot:218642-Hanusia_phi.AAC.1
MLPGASTDLASPICGAFHCLRLRALLLEVSRLVDDDLRLLGDLSKIHTSAYKQLVRATHLPTLQYFLR